MSTDLLESEGIMVTRFACGACHKAGPCFQITSKDSRAGDYVVVHRNEAADVCRVLLEEIERRK